MRKSLDRSSITQVLGSGDVQLFSISNNNTDKASIRTESHEFHHKITDNNQIQFHVNI